MMVRQTTGSGRLLRGIVECDLDVASTRPLPPLLNAHSLELTLVILPMFCGICSEDDNLPLSTLEKLPQLRVFRI